MGKAGSGGRPQGGIRLSVADQEGGPSGQRRILYGRRTGRRLRRGQADLVENLLPKLEIAAPAEGQLPTPATLFDFTPRDAWLEIGFGAGEHLLQQAKNHPDIGIIGCEPFLNGVVKLLGGVRDLGLRNILLFRDDAQLLIGSLPDASVGRVFILFPDPWPKTRHHKRRIVSSATLDQLARAMKSGAELRIATDDSSYLAWILQYVLRHGGFEWTARRPTDWRERPPDWPATRYEHKAVEAGRRCAFLRFARR